MKTAEKLREAAHWLSCQPQQVQSKALEELLEFAIDAEWIGVQETGEPYFRTCGDVLGETK